MSAVHTAHDPAAIRAGDAVANGNGAGERMHVLVLTDRDWTHPQGGGTGTNLFGQVSRWLAWGHRVTLIACGYPGGAAREQIGDLTIHRVGGRSTVFPHAIVRQWRGLVPDADVVLEVVNGITFLTPLWLRTPRLTLVHHIHRDHYVREMGTPGRIAAMVLETLPLKLLYRRAPFLTISHASAAEIARVGIPREHIAVGYIGVELETFSRNASRRAERPTLLYLGRLKRYKRIELLLDALVANPDAVLEIAGDGDYREELEAAIRERGVEERVRLHGHVTEERKRELLQEAWVNVTASSAEGWCLSVMEAAASGTPTVALAVGGLPESIDEGRTGLLAQDAEDLGRKIGDVLRDPELRDRLGDAAYQRAHEFTWDQTARDTLALLARERARSLKHAGVTAGAIAGPRSSNGNRTPVAHDDFAEALESARGVEGWLSDDQAERLFVAGRSVTAGGRIVEIGSYRGRSTIVLAGAAADDVEVVAIDPHAGNDRGPQEIEGYDREAEQDYRTFHDNLARAGVDDRVRHVRQPSQDALAEVSGDVDVLYVDGAHRYGPASDDIRRWGARVRPGGTMLIHDSFSSIGVTLAIGRLLLGSRGWRYVGRSRSLAEYERVVKPLGPGEWARNASLQLAQLPWFARNVAVKLALVARLRPLARALGHRDGGWPY
jgi:glycosyltransferase involved in cell wall biosynthesis/predicted O-methyltransferase YrrM